MIKATSTLFNSKGRLSQTDFAENAVNFSEPMVVIKTKKRVLILAKKNDEEKDENSIWKSKIFVIDKSLGIAGCGLNTDLKIIVKRARKIAKNFSFVYGKKISVNILSSELSNFFQEFTYTGGTRPFGASIFIMGFSKEGPELFQINPDGNTCNLKANMIGKGADQGLKYLGKRWNKHLTYEETMIMGFLTLKEAIGRELESFDINAGLIDEGGIFKILTNRDIKILLTSIL